MKSRGKVILGKTAGRSLRFGHPWIYKSLIKEADDGARAGELVDVFYEKGRFLGTGYFNEKSQIAIRLLTRREEPVDKEFFKRKIQAAFNFRKHFVRDTNAYRVISSEADELPGLIVDLYGETLVAQFLTLGMERLREIILEALREVVSPRGIYERSDSSSRRIEGLEERIGWIEQSCGDEVIIFEKNARFKVQFGQGHKTGFYLDQRDNRILLSELGLKGNVLDAFCGTGGFGIHLALTGCKVLGVDIQETVIGQARENRELNALSEDRLEFKTANVFDELRVLEGAGRKFDLVILDPPSFVKKKDALEGALSGTKEIILRAIKLLGEDGLLAVFSCSYHMDETLLMQTAMSAAQDTRKNLKIIKFLKQSVDHPISPFVPETYYLKGFLFQVTSL